MQKKKGVSLIVLVITIIVMTILATAVVISINNSEIVERGKTAVSETNLKKVQTMGDMYWSEGYMDGLRGQDLKDYVEEKIEEEIGEKEYVKYYIIVTDKGTNVIKGWRYKKDSNNKYTLVTNGLEDLGIGDTINYVATGTSYTGEWCILGANEYGEILITSRENTATKRIESQDWENAVNILNAECIAYGNGKGASTKTSARSITAEDINKLTGYNPLNTGVYDPDKTGTGDVFNGGSYEIFNETKTYTSGTFYEGNDWVEASSTNPVKMTQTAYYYYFSTLNTSSIGSVVGLRTSELQENKIYNMIFEYHYWLASPCVNLQTSSVNYDLMIVEGDSR